jgi:hypothetical protein
MLMNCFKLRLPVYAQVCVGTHTHTNTHIYSYKYVHMYTLLLKMLIDCLKHRLVVMRRIAFGDHKSRPNWRLGRLSTLFFTSLRFAVSCRLTAICIDVSISLSLSLSLSLCLSLCACVRLCVCVYVCVCTCVCLCVRVCGGLGWQQPTVQMGPRPFPFLQGSSHTSEVQKFSKNPCFGPLQSPETILDRHWLLSICARRYNLLGINTHASDSEPEDIEVKETYYRCKRDLLEVRRYNLDCMSNAHGPEELQVFSYRYRRCSLTL